MFYDNYLKLCELKGIAPTSLLTEIGISKGAISGWKNGAEPTNRTKKQIADYFDVTVSELMSGEIKKLAPDEKDKLSSDETLVLDIMRRLPPEKRKQAEDYLRFLSENQ